MKIFQAKAEEYSKCFTGVLSYVSLQRNCDQSKCFVQQIFYRKTGAYISVSRLLAFMLYNAKYNLGRKNVRKDKITVLKYFFQDFYICYRML
jgi:hypothetical protein